ncbi:hypothetical protein OQA88_13148 [Cercophora sp. LCS_1]
MATPDNHTLLEPMSLHDPIQFTALHNQRVLCGWRNALSDIESLRAASDSGTQIIFWIVPPSLSHLPAPERYVGHIAGSRKIYPDEEKGLPFKTAIDLHTFFILQEHRGGGLGRAAVRALERVACSELGWPDCRVITLNTLARRYVEEDEWREFATGPHEQMGAVLPAKGKSNEDWYGRMGYAKWKEEELYEAVGDDGQAIKLGASFMWKMVG